VVDVREGSKLEKLPGILKAVRRMIPTKVAFLEASDAVLLRRFSETRRPHPLGTDAPVNASLKAERRHLAKIRALADIVIDTSKFNVHELRAHITELTWSSTFASFPTHTSSQNSARSPAAIRVWLNTSGRFPRRRNSFGAFQTC
jgi:RNase adaptor protein for sRNA GlmZ degradation